MQIFLAAEGLVRYLVAIPGLVVEVIPWTVGVRRLAALG